MTTNEAPNPIGLLRELAKDAADIHELLICTYNHDLGFFEKTILGAARATGARVTVLGDVNATDHDPAAINRAGITYLPGLAQARGAFHPKVIIAAGPQRSLVAVGSGNLTLAGWWGNDELWSVHHGSEGSASPVLGQTADWCRQLPNHVGVDPYVVDALDRTATMLDAHPATGDECYAVHTLNTPIIEQLPAGPVDELHLYAPFYDLSGDAVAALCDQLKPTTLVVAYQPELTSADGPRLLARLPAGTGLRALEASRYRHGKLVEWSINGHWTALTGSPNLSGAALLTTTKTGGNVEFGVVAPVDEPLLPDGHVSSSAELEALRPGRRAATRSGLLHLLLSATRLDDTHVRVVFGRPCPPDTILQAAQPGDLPDHWHDIGPVDTAARTLDTDSDLPGGSRVRAVVAGRPSVFVPVTDPGAALHRRSHGAARVRAAPGYDRIFTDPAALEELFRLHQQLLDSSEASPTPTATTSAGSKQPSDPGSHTVGDWRDYLDAVAPVVGGDTMAWLFGLDTAPSPAKSRPILDIDWDDDDPDAIDALEHDTDEAVDEIADQLDTGISDWQIAERHRSRFRRAAGTTPPENEPLSQAYLRLRALLQVIAAGAWSTRDDAWVEPVLVRLERLPATYQNASPDVQEHFGPLVGSAAAVALSVVATEVTGLQVTRRTLRYRALRDQLGYLLVPADRDVIESQTKTLRKRFGLDVHPDEVLARAEAAVENDPFADGCDRLIRDGRDHVVHGRVVHVLEPAADAVYLSMVLVSRFDRAEPVAVVVEDQTGRPHVAAATASHLLLLAPGAKPGAFWGRTYRFGAFLKLRDLVDGNLNTLPPPTEEFMVGQKPGAKALSVLGTLGLVDADGHPHVPDNSDSGLP